MQQLPSELRLSIASLLNEAEADAVEKGLQLPALRHSRAPRTGPLVALSSTCRAWRAITKPLLFSRLVICVTHSSTKNVSTINQLKYGMKSVIERLHSVPIGRSGSSAVVERLTVEFDLTTDQTTMTRQPAKHSSDIISMNEFWQAVCELLCPRLLSIVAPVGVLGLVTYTSPDLSFDWAFDMDIQRLDLRRDSSSAESVDKIRGAMSAWDTEYLFNVQRWESLSLWEGSMLKAYGRYEYHHQEPPTILGGVDLPRSDTITSFRLRTVFPFSTHVDEVQLLSLSHYQKLHFHLTPAPDLHILSDPDLVGKADMADCWRETEQIYQRALGLQALFGSSSQLVEFSSGDYSVDSVRRLLDDGFAKLHTHGWRSSGIGVWTRPKRSLGIGFASRAPWA